MNTSKFFLLLLFTAVTTGDTNAGEANRTISGIVTSSEESTPLEGATVTDKGTKLASGSQADGIYYISISDKDSVLLFSLSASTIITMVRKIWRKKIFSGSLANKTIGRHL